MVLITEITNQTLSKDANADSSDKVRKKPEKIADEVLRSLEYFSSGDSPSPETTAVETREKIGVGKTLGKAPKGVEVFRSSENDARKGFDEMPHSAENEALCSDNYGLRVSYIMRSCMKTGGRGSLGSELVSSSGDDKCCAMMEIVRSNSGQWSVSRVVLEHNHPINPLVGAVGGGSFIPVVGMEFESVSVSEAYYGAYSEKMGFQMKTAPGKRSRDGGGLIMQRFLCVRGCFPLERSAIESSRKKMYVTDETKASVGIKRIVRGYFPSEGNEVVRGYFPSEGNAVKSARKKKRVMDANVGVERIENEVVEVVDVDEPLREVELVDVGRQCDGQVRRLEKDTVFETGKSSSAARQDRGKRKENEVIEVINVDEPLQEMELVDVDQQGDGQVRQLENDRVLETGKSSGASRQDEDKGKLPEVSSPSQSILLRDLGIKVSKYTSEERRNVILKYMQKRGKRQGVDRSLKVPSRQALAERRQRGVGGKFISKEEMQTMNRQDEGKEEEPELPEEVAANAGGVPIIGMAFENEDKAYDYYVKYAGTVGFSVRKGWWVRPSKSVNRSRSYVCSREGFRPDNDARRPRPETRTGCPAHMAIKITSSGKYRVTEFVADHNHQLAAPLDFQILNSQKLLLKVQPSGHQKASCIPSGYKNYLRAKRSRDVQSGDIEASLEYFQKMKGDNPSFYYAIQVDDHDQITNIFWADAKSIIDYHYFGDVVCFDTSYSASDYGRPLSLFLGVNHHKQTIIFAAAFLYEKSMESYKWLFEAFKTAMDDEQPRTIVTDQSAEINDAIAAVWPGTVQQICLWQLYQNAFNQLGLVFEASETFAHDFSRCIYDLEDEEEFLLAWKFMLEKYELKDNEWLSKLFEEKESWALAYAQQTFHGDIKSTLCSENLSTLLKENLNLEKDLLHFLIFFEMLLDERRSAELQADYNASQVNPIIPTSRLLWQAANAYTPAVFGVFKRELDLCMDCIVCSVDDVGSLSKYQVTVKERNRAHCVRFDAADGSVICSCGKFESVGILCCHALKVLDFRNIEELPPQYFLKRWRKDAKVGNLREDSGIVLDSDPKFSISKRYNSLCRILFKIAAKAAENEDTFMLMVNQSDNLFEQVEQILQRTFNEKQSLDNSSKAPLQNANEMGSSFRDNGIETQKAGGKKRSNGAMCRRHQSEVEVDGNRIGQTDDAEPHPTPSSMSSLPRNPSNQFLTPSHFMQDHLLPHQFGLGTTHEFHPMTQFDQDSSASALQQQFLGTSSMTQGFPTSDALQFIVGNSQLDHQGSIPGQSAIPVWDFL